MISLVRSQAPKASAGLLFRKRCVALFSGAKLCIIQHTCKHKTFITNNVSFHETIVAHYERFLYAMREIGP